MPLITQMIEIQLFPELCKVIINLNLHCMRMELLLLFLIETKSVGVAQI